MTNDLPLDLKRECEIKIKTSKSEGPKKKLTPLGWILSIGGMMLAVLSYFLLDIGQFFLELNGVLGLNETYWVIIGGVVWLFVIMAILTPIILKLGTKTIA
ncbi:MAG: hypothetical protein ACFFC6_00480 [Promethearchaeota archaeon]